MFNPIFSTCLSDLEANTIPSVFFVISALTELGLGRHRKKEQRFGPSPANNYTSGYGRGGRAARFGSLFRRKPAAKDPDENELPAHPEPTALRTSYATDATRVDHNNGSSGGGYPSKYGDVGTTKYSENGAGGFVPPPAGTNPANGSGYAGATGGYGGNRYGDGTYTV